MGDLEVLQTAHHRHLHHMPAKSLPYLNATSGNTTSTSVVTSSQNSSCHLVLTPPSARRNHGAVHAASCSELARRKPSCLSTEESRMRARKSVVFADAIGLALTQVRIMSEPSEVPPFWSRHFLSQLTAAATGLPTHNNNFKQYNNNGGGDDSCAANFTPNANPWLPTFTQPARDYVEFRRRLDESCVALENVAVIVESCRAKVVGTIKVRNLDYHKEVTLRYTIDGWKTFKDETCSHVPTPPSKINCSNQHPIYDTFRFEFSLPSSPQANCVEFCLRYLCNGGEYWDNNRGANYSLKRRASLSHVGPTYNGSTHSSSVHMNNRRVTEATSAKIGAWSEFASWEHLENNCPYW